MSKINLVNIHKATGFILLFFFKRRRQACLLYFALLQRPVQHIDTINIDEIFQAKIKHALSTMKPNID